MGWKAEFSPGFLQFEISQPIREEKREGGMEEGKEENLWAFA